jgi:hypothetical protein
VHSCMYNDILQIYNASSIILLFCLKHCIPFVCLSSWRSGLCIFFASHLQLLLHTTNIRFYQWRIKVDVIFLHNSKKKMQRAVGERMGKGKNKLDNTFFPINQKNQNKHNANQSSYICQTFTPKTWQLQMLRY